MILSLMLGTFLLSGCKKFLDVQPKDLKLAQSVKDYEDLLNGEGFKKPLATGGQEDLNFLEMLTDDVDQNLGLGAGDIRTKYSSFYVWRNVYEDDYLTGGLSQMNARIWQYLYKMANVCNIVINEIDEVPGNETDRNFVKAEAYFTRAFVYYFILNIWGEPYQPATAASAKGVPIKLTNYAEFSGLPRSSVADGYEQIINDLKDAEKYLVQSGIKKDMFFVSKEAIYLLLSRMYLYTQNWEQTVTYADKVIALKPDLYNMLSETFTTTTATGFLNPRNPELIYTYYNRPTTPASIYGGNTYRHFNASADFYNLYITNDKRKNAYFYLATLLTVTRYPKTMLKTSGIKSYNFYLRNAEAYLNRAEAYAQLSQLDKAADDYNFLRKHRIVNVATASFTSQSTALTEIYKERRLELAFQFHRWFDLRRTTRPSITHQFKLLNGPDTQVFVLKENDPGYTLEIPLAETKVNTSIELMNHSFRLPE